MAVLVVVDGWVEMDMTVGMVGLDKWVQLVGMVVMAWVVLAV